MFNHVQLSATSRTVAHQAPLSMDFSRQEYWSGLPFPSPGELPDPGIEPTSLTLAHRFFITEPPGKPHVKIQCSKILLKIRLKNPQKTKERSLQIVASGKCDWKKEGGQSVSIAFHCDFLL